jgi:hypothetical protein
LFRDAEAQPLFLLHPDNPDLFQPAAAPRSGPTLGTKAGLRTELFDREGGDLLGIASTVSPNMNHLAGDDLANRVVAINQVEPDKGCIERRPQAFDFSALDCFRLSNG